MLTPTALQIADYRFRTHAISCHECSTPGVCVCDQGLRLLREFNRELVQELLQERGIVLAQGPQL